MATPKYKLTLKMIETVGEIAKLERDGFTREQISKTMYRETDGASQDYRNKIFTNLHEREQK